MIYQYSHRLFPRIAAFLAVLTLAGAPLQATAADHPHKISIAQARTLPLGTVVTVAGSVTTPSGAFESSFFDKGFGLQDRTAGIYVSLQTDLGVAPPAWPASPARCRTASVCSSWYRPIPRTPTSAAAARGSGRDSCAPTPSTRRRKVCSSR